MNVEVREHLAHFVSEYQTIDIYDTEVFGKVLFLDGHVQLSSFDEAAYHECLVQIPMLSMDAPTSALVVGGGDGGVLRELVKHPTLERIDMVEIDRGVIEVCREHLPELSAGAFDDPRVNLLIGDAFPFVKEASGPYDLIVMDSTDTYEDEQGALSEQLFTADFYRDILRILADDGIVVTQADNLVFCPYSLETILWTWKDLFPKTGSYFGLIPSFGGYSGYAWASKGTEPKKEFPAHSLPLHYLNEATYNLAFTQLAFS